jgi:hypothetical protein
MATPLGGCERVELAPVAAPAPAAALALAPSAVTVTVKTLRGDSFDLLLSRPATIAEVKRQLQTLSGVALRGQQLHQAGIEEPLLDGKTSTVAKIQRANFL